MKTSLPLLFLWFTLTCVAAAAADLPQLFAKSEAGFADAELKAQKVEKDASGGLVVTAAAKAGPEDVAFQVVLSVQWSTSKPQGFPGPLHRGTVTIKSAGKPTEAFVRALAKAYGQKFERSAMSEVTLTALSLEGDPRKALTSLVKLKLFYESAKEEEYAEVYLNLDLLHGVVQFHEKDPEYRKAVVGFLSRG
ncbi:MAG: hypothetical protein A3G75_04045 [Verrucomicrobia bacterium RIFCSPLOWO2_12_FULL_64_8]|nr:MAG: hypothetical protein A3G75_04045 [Verrucomicrobia bacterium RIFCSPLOWO2_12_FULL_64_8]